MTQIDRYVSHLSCCSSLVCGQCREAKESDIHYSGTVDSHVFQEVDTCDCGLEAELAAIRSLEQRLGARQRCGVIGHPEAGILTCELDAGHEQQGEAYHRSGSVRWIGYHLTKR
jgi:hypothetical protein